MTRSILLLVLVAACGNKHPSLSDCKRATDHVVELMLRDAPIPDPELVKEAKRVLAGQSPDKLDHACHEQATPGQIACLKRAEDVADLRSCVRDASAPRWAWGQDLFVNVMAP
jgi:hypothetical protein